MNETRKIKVLAVGAHPDDISFGVGGTVARHTMEGDEVYFLILTYGEKTGDKEVRRKEALESAKVLNVRSVSFAEIPDTMVTQGIETILKIEEAIKRVKPDRVYTLCTKDTHQDHRNAAFATLSAAKRIHEVFSYELPQTFPNFTPQYYVQITSTLPKKIEALKKFHSQHNKEHLWMAAIKGLAHFRGYQIGIEHAEAFEVIRTIRL